VPYFLLGCGFGSATALEVGGASELGLWCGRRIWGCAFVLGFGVTQRRKLHQGGDLYAAVRVEREMTSIEYMNKSIPHAQVPSGSDPVEKTRSYLPRSQ